MKELIWYFKCMLSARKYRKDSQIMEDEYQWYKYLVIWILKSFLKSFKFWKNKGDLPF